MLYFNIQRTEKYSIAMCYPSCGMCDFVCTFPQYRSRFKIRRGVALGSIEEIFLYTENQLYLVGGTNSCSCNVHLNLSFKKRWDFNKMGQKSHTQKNKCSPTYIPKFQNSKFKMLSSLFITWCPDGRICNSGEPLLKLASPAFQI